MTTKPILTSTPFKHYFGDLVVVVIGVLLALGVSQWIEGLNETARTRSYLEAIIQDFEDNKGIAEKSRDNGAYQAELSRWLLDVSHGRVVADDPRRLAMAIEVSSYNYFDTYHKTGWDDLVSSGDLSNLEDAGLRRKIGMFYRFQEHSQDFEAEWAQLIMSYRSNALSVLDADVRLEVFRTLDNFQSDNSAEMVIPGVSSKNLIRSFNSVIGLDSRLADVIMVREVTRIRNDEEIVLIEEILVSLRENLSRL